MRRFALACLALLGGALAGYIVAENPPTRPAWAQGGAFGLTPSTAASISVTGTSSRVQLGASGTTILLQNTGTNDAFVAFGGSGVTATTSSHSLPAGKSIAYNAAASSYVAAITASSTTTVKVSQGFGSTAVGGGGSGSGGGGGDVNVTEWAGDTLGAPSNYGTSPGAVAVPGVNAFVTNANTNGRASAANSSPTVQAYGAYETVAASQTAQSLGAAGATGDYLSHCVVTPGTTSPGVVTILDNATAIVSFAGGASSVSNLVPFAIPIGAISVSGAWKITTGANVTVVCVGTFT